MWNWAIIGCNNYVTCENIKTDSVILLNECVTDFELSVDELGKITILATLRITMHQWYMENKWTWNFDVLDSASVYNLNF